MKKVTKGNVTIKLWDIGGQERFRTMWERYCRGVNAILYFINFSRYLFHFFSTSIQNDYHLSAFTDEYCSSLIFFLRFVVDAADREKFEKASAELSELLSKPPLAGIPLLVVGNKVDLEGAAKQEEIIEALYFSFLFSFVV